VNSRRCLGLLEFGPRDLTLSGGESQRIKMIRHLGNSLTDMPYVLDEPSVGLHARDVARLNGLLHKLRDKGNTLDYTYEMDGNTLTIWGGEKGSPAYMTGSFSHDGNTLTSEWVYPGGGGYKSTMTRVK
jgi:hypothetical protein